MRELMAELTYAEFWVLQYLVLLASEQGRLDVTVPKPGEDPLLDGGICRRHFRRLLVSLKKKRGITVLMVSRSKSKRIEVLLPGKLLGTPRSPILKMEDSQVPNNVGLGTPRSAISGLGTPRSAIISGIMRVCRDLPPSFAIAIKALNKYLSKAKQKDLKKDLREAGEPEVEMILGILRLAGVEEPKVRKISKRAKLYAEIRFIQKETHGQTESTQRPGAWMATVARQVHKEWEGQGFLFQGE